MKKKIVYILFLACVFIFLFYPQKNAENSGNSTVLTDADLQQLLFNQKIPQYSYRLIAAYSHDTNSFTEGLILQDDFLYESTGLYANSKIRKFSLKTGDMVKEFLLPKKYFAEGITIIGDNIYQLTYKEHAGFIYDKRTLKLKKTFFYPHEGWGLTNDGIQLIMSNGSAILSFINPQTFKIEKNLWVAAGKIPIYYLNELEYVQGKIYINVWPTSIVILVSPKTGQVLGWINLKKLKLVSHGMFDYAANGIAFNEKNNTLFVTGKNWAYLYEIKIEK